MDKPWIGRWRAPVLLALVIVACASTSVNVRIASVLDKSAPPPLTISVFSRHVTQSARSRTCIAEQEYLGGGAQHASLEHFSHISAESRYRG